MDFEKCSDSGGLGKWHRIEVYFFGVCVIAMGGIKPKLRSDRKEYISAKLTPLQCIRGKSCPLRMGRFTLGVNLEISDVTGCRFLELSTGENIFLRTSAITDGYPWRDPCRARNEPKHGA
jgi:hypothetical protein